MITAAAALAAWLGFGWLALAMGVHWRQVQGQEGPGPVTRRWLRSLGSIGLIGSGALCFAANRPSIAILVWIMLLSAAAPCVAFLLTWRARALRILWPFPGQSSLD